VGVAAGTSHPAASYAASCGTARRRPADSIDAVHAVTACSSTAGPDTAGNFDHSAAAHAVAVDSEDTAWNSVGAFIAGLDAEADDTRWTVSAVIAGSVATDQPTDFRADQSDPDSSSDAAAPVRSGSDSASDQFQPEPGSTGV
jgi:hypothetical protein